jgi:hypothetical protein
MDNHQHSHLWISEEQQNEEANNAASAAASAAATIGYDHQQQHPQSQFGYYPPNCPKEYCHEFIGPGIDQYTNTSHNKYANHNNPWVYMDVDQQTQIIQPSSQPVPKQEQIIQQDNSIIPQAKRNRLFYITALFH